VLGTSKKLLGLRNSGGASSPRATARKFKQTGDLKWFPPLFPSLLAVKATSPAKPRKHNNYFILFFLLRSGSSGSDSQFVVLSFFRWQICRGA